MSLAPVLSDFYDSLPVMPYCADALHQGIYREHRETAAKKQHIQPNPHQFTEWLVFDIDRPDGHELWLDCGLHPNIVCVNPANNHAHYFLRLSSPVCMTENARPGPIRYLTNAIRGVNALYDGDDGYARLIAKNPLNPHWITHTPRHAPYQLDDFREYAELAANDTRFARDRQIDTITGRNKALFDILRFWCYDRVEQAREQGSFEAFQREALTYAEHANAFEIPKIFNEQPLGSREVLATVRSVSKWVWTHYSAHHDGKNRGVLGLGLTRHHSIEAPTLTDAERKARQRAGAEYTNAARKAATEAKIKTAIAQLRKDGKRVSKAAVARLSGVSRSKVVELYGHLFER